MKTNPPKITCLQCGLEKLYMRTYHACGRRPVMTYVCKSYHCKNIEKIKISYGKVSWE